MGVEDGKTIKRGKRESEKGLVVDPRLNRHSPRDTLTRRLKKALPAGEQREKTKKATQGEQGPSSMADHTSLAHHKNEFNRTTKVGNIG